MLKFKSVTIDEQDVPIKDGYTFIGWYKDQNYETIYNNDPIVENTTLYAKFIKHVNARMEETVTNASMTITTIDNEKSYSIDVDETTTFYEFKKILSAAAHLLKNCFRIYHEEQEYTNDYDDNTIQEMFPELDPIPLKIF